jgi:tRNA-2-methylthio-N6-dimethylallyladenosine synthase
LIESQNKQSTQDVPGRTRAGKVINFKGDLGLIGELVPVHIVKGYPHSLKGEIRSD